MLLDALLFIISNLSSSITDIQTLMEPLTGKYFQKEAGYNLNLATTESWN